MDELSYNGKNFSEFNTFFDGSKAFGSPEKDYELVEIMGRNGSLSIYNDRFKDILLPFPCFVRSSFLTHYRQLVEFLNSQHGYLRLETSKEPNHFRKALFQGIVEPQTTPFNHGGQFTINFLAKPQRFLKSGETPVSSQSQDEEYEGNPVSINNPSGLSNVKSLEVGLEPIQSGSGDPAPDNVRPITGHTEVNVVRTGKNLLPYPYTTTSGTSNGITRTINADGSIKISGTASATSWFKFYGGFDTDTTLRKPVPSWILPDVTYCVSGGVASNKSIRVYCYDGNGGSTQIANDSGSGATFSLTQSEIDATAYFAVFFRIANGTAINDPITIYPQLELGSTPTSYEPYTGTTYTTDLGSTVYGGTLDVTTGVLTINRLHYTMTGDPSATQASGMIFSKSSSPTNNTYYALSSGGNVTNGSGDDVVLSSHFINQGDTPQRCYVSSNQFRVMLPMDSDIQTANDMNAWVAQQYANGTPLEYCVTLIEPTTVQLTPTQVSLLTGKNVISIDGDTLTVTVTEPSLLVNPTLFESKPLLRIYGTGTVNINDKYITISAHSFPYIDIDCELMDAFYGSSNANQYVTFSDNDYITLKSGNNYIAYGNQIEVTPRWFEI